jgi:ribosomal-protein-alanine N-acetyltransferase
VRIRSFSGEDLAAIMTIQNQAAQAAQWRPPDYASLAGDTLGLILVAELDDLTPPRIVGFAAFHRVLDEAELRNMAVARDSQRRGVGRELLEEGLNRLRGMGVGQIFLEVRVSNLPAQRLYRSVGFSLRSRRRNYYVDPPEDSLVLGLTSP